MFAVGIEMRLAFNRAKGGKPEKQKLKSELIPCGALVVAELFDGVDVKLIAIGNALSQSFFVHAQASASYSRRR
jgi:hypothetical protein